MWSKKYSIIKLAGKSNSVLIVDAVEIIIEIIHYSPDLYYFVVILNALGLLIP